MVSNVRRAQTLTSRLEDLSFLKDQPNTPRLLRQSLRRRHRAVSDRPVVRRRRPLARRRSRRGLGATSFVPKNWEKTYFRWMEHSALVHLAPALVEPPDPAWYGGRQVFVAETRKRRLATRSVLRRAGGHYA
jgi:valyl-tRNA synthetase